jgi:hypothetical protein
MINEVLDNAIILNRLLWIMDAESINKLLAITQAHLRLAKEHGSIGTLPERRQVIRADINSLRIERNNLIKGH